MDRKRLDQYYSKLIKYSEKYIEKYGTVRGSPDKVLKQELDKNFIFDYRFFVLTKCTKTLLAIQHMIREGFYEDVLILSRTICECYFYNRYIEENYNVKVQTEKIMVPVGVIQGSLIQDINSVRVRENNELVKVEEQSLGSMLRNKDKDIYYTLYDYLCTVTHCNFSQVFNYLDEKKRGFVLFTEEAADLASVVGLYTFSKIYENTILADGMPFEDKIEQTQYEELFIDLIFSLYNILDNYQEIHLPKRVAATRLKKVYTSMKTSFKDQVGRVDKGFVSLLENQKKNSDRISKLNDALLKFEKPSLFFESITNDNDKIKYYELFHLSPVAFHHTMETLDRAAQYRDKVKYPFGFMFLALVHNFTADNIFEKFVKRIMPPVSACRYVKKMLPAVGYLVSAIKANEPKQEMNEFLENFLFPKDLACFIVSDELLSDGEMEVFKEYL